MLWELTPLLQVLNNYQMPHIEGLDLFKGKVSVNFPEH